MTLAVLTLAIWLSQYAETALAPLSGRSSGSTDSLFAIYLLVTVLCGCLVSAGVGAIIDGRQGALWGFFLGPIGWVIASIRRLERRAPAKPTTTASKHTETEQSQAREAAPPAFDLKKWGILKDVDADIRAASDRVSEIDPLLDGILAEKYLTLSDKSYLEQLVVKIISDAKLKRSKEKFIGHDVKPGIYEVTGMFRLRVMPDRSVIILSNLSGELSNYERFDDLEQFFQAYSTSCIEADMLKSLD